MKHLALLLALVACATTPAVAAGPEDTAIEVRTRLDSYLDVFNSGDSDALAGYWSEHATSLDEETGQRTAGRTAILEEFRLLFKESPGARLTGQVDRVRQVRPDVAIAEGVVTLALPDAEPTPSAFTAVLVKDDGQWVIESSQERDLPTPESSYDALRPLEWLVGDWRDDSEGVEVNTTVRWSPSGAFLIRSFSADYGESESFDGTQIIGWDPRGKQFRTWTFNSDGSFGEGFVSRSGESWLIRMSHIGADGGMTTGTQVLTRVDDDAMRVEKIGQTVDGVPIPVGDPVTVLRVSPTESSNSVEGAVQ